MERRSLGASLCNPQDRITDPYGINNQYCSTIGNEAFGPGLLTGGDQ